MAKGGYQIIDLENRNLLSGQPTKYDGIYDIIESTKSAILLTNITVDGVEMHDSFVTCSTHGDAIVLSFTVVDDGGGVEYHIFLVDNDNNITYTNA